MIFLVVNVDNTVDHLEYTYKKFIVYNKSFLKYSYLVSSFKVIAHISYEIKIFLKVLTFDFWLFWTGLAGRNLVSPIYK